LNLDFDPQTQQFRREVAGWLAEHVPAARLPSVDTAEGFTQHREWEAKLAEARLAAVSWPAEFGGRAASLLEWLVFEEEYYAADAPVRVGQNGMFGLAPTLLTHGTDEQRARILPPMARGDEVWAQAWSEAGAGSDLAAIRSRAVRTDGGWLLSGAKTWCTRAVFADRAFGLFRSDPQSERHRGLTYVMFDLRGDGVTIRPIPQLDGEAGFAEIFLEEVFVPDADVIGEPGHGWQVAMSWAAYTRGLPLRSPGRFTATAARLVDLWQRRGDPADTELAGRVADAWIAARAYQLHGYRLASRADEGRGGPLSSLTKVFWSELDLAMHETALDILGARAELRDEAEPDGRWLDGYLFALAGPIYAGTNEIQRTILAERVLGLPR
jgi:alkylation response protein AidB-like acyl-CoA dehydrogenase